MVIVKDSVHDNRDELITEMITKIEKTVQEIEWEKIKEVDTEVRVVADHQ